MTKNPHNAENPKIWSVSLAQQAEPPPAYRHTRRDRHARAPPLLTQFALYWPDPDQKEIASRRADATLKQLPRINWNELRHYQLIKDDCGQDIAKYAVMPAVILVVVVGTIRLIGSNSASVFSNVASSVQ